MPRRSLIQRHAADGSDWRHTYPYHEHRWGPADWQVSGRGYMTQGQPKLDHCPPACPEPWTPKGLTPRTNG